MKVVLIGGSGQLGIEIRKRWTDDEIVAPAHASVELESKEGMEALVSAERPDLLVNCAAFHNVDVCENEPARAFAVNAIATDAAAAVCDRFGVTFVTISTDYVFDGLARRPYTEMDCANPISVYGASKRAGESLVLRRNSKAFVVRTSGVYSTRASQNKTTFIDRIIAQALAAESIRVVDDVVASPTYAGHLAEALRQLVRSRAYGLYHAANVGAVTWYDFAAAALKRAGINYPIQRISWSQWTAAARRPVFSALANEKLHGLGISMPRWDEGIDAYLRDRRTMNGS